MPWSSSRTPATPCCRRCAARTQAGVKTVPYRVFPGGTDGKDYDVWVGADFANDGKNWANWIIKNLPDGGNVLFLSGPDGQQPGHSPR